MAVATKAAACVSLLSDRFWRSEETLCFEIRRLASGVCLPSSFGMTKANFEELVTV